MNESENEGEAQWCEETRTTESGRVARCVLPPHANDRHYMLWQYQDDLVTP